MGRIILENLNNTRDLGGVKAAGGIIAPGKLIRSGQLGKASEKDIRWLADNVSAVIDFRSSAERDELPDPVIEGMENTHVSVIDDLAAGVSRDSKSDEEAIRMLTAHPEHAKGYMCSMYESFVESEAARRGYEAFVRKLLEDREKAILWHCTVGKDRAGFATAIVLEMLGADRETIYEDYLATNEYIEQDIESLVAFYFGETGTAESRAETALRYLFGAKQEFLEAAYSKAEKMYGSFDGYIREGLHIMDADIAALRVCNIINI